MQIVVTGGGTGGHVYPAMAIVAALRARVPDVEVRYVGSAGGMEAEIVRHQGLPFTGIQAGAIRGRGVFGLARSLVHLAVGFGQSVSTLCKVGPGAILATGGYVCVPVVLAGWLGGVPSVLYLPDVEPGWAIRFLARLAWRTAVTSEQSSRYLAGARIVATGYPARPELRQRDRAASRERLGLPPNERVVLISGGSRGARSINEAVMAGADALTRRAVILHVGGARDADWLEERHRVLPAPVRERYRLYRYLHDEFADALAAADLAISRSGASVLGEYPAVGLPSVLIPYPYAGAHQRQNARVLADAGAAVVLPDGQIGELVATTCALLADGDRLVEMAKAARQLSRLDAATRIAALVQEAASQHVSAMVNRPGRVG